MPIKYIFSTTCDENVGIPLDIVAVHGLDEDATSAWTHEESGCLWLLDMLSKEENINARILVVEYKADATSFFGSSSQERISHHAETLVADLDADRDLNGTSRRPIIFICHGLGGIIVKKALIYSSMSTSRKVSHLYYIFTLTLGLVFFGTPHEGIRRANWSLLAKGWKGILKDRSNLVAAIEKDSETLENISEQFAPLLKHFYIHNFWEALETRQALAKDYIVTRSSAAPAWDNTSQSGLPAAHSRMCKFRNRGEPGYKAICSFISRIKRKADQDCSTRLKGADDYLTGQRQSEANEILAFNVHRGNESFNVHLETTVEIQNRHFLVPFRVSDHYTGREELALDLQEKLFEPLAQQKRYVLYGLGGSGKTQFCLKFASDHKERFWGVFWVNASSQETAEQAFRDFARIDQPESEFQAGLHWLSAQKLPWLLIIDNANDASLDYAQYFPSGGEGFILVTSRNPDCKVHATIGFKEFINLEECDAITLLLRSAAMDDPTDKKLRKAAHPIVKALGYLPLAIIQAGASIRQNICPLSEYLDIFNSYKKIIFSGQQIQGRGSYEYTIFTTFEVSFNDVARLGTDEAIDSIEILQLIAFLHFSQVPEALFENAWKSMLNHEQGILKAVYDGVASVFGNLVTVSTSYRGWLTFLAEGRCPRIFSQAGKEWDKFRFRRAMALLRAYSLIIQNSTEGSYSMHPMVQFWARERLRPREQKLWGNMAAKILAEGITTTIGESDVIYRRRLIPHVDSCLKIDSVDSRQGLKFEDSSVGQFIKFAALYSEGGRWIEASKLQELLLKQRREIVGQESDETLKIMASLSHSYWNASYLENALKIQTRLLNVCNERLGQYDPRTLQAMDFLGRTKWLCGEISEAHRLGQKAYQDSTKVLGPDHPITLSAMHNYGRSCSHMGDRELAKSLLNIAWEGRRSIIGETHLDTLETIQELAMCCFALEEVDEAAYLVHFVLDVRKRLLGPEHAHTLWSINDLSKIYCAQGYPKDAVDILIPTKEIASRTLGTTHIGTAMTISNLAAAYKLLNELGQAELILTELIRSEKISLGPNHPDVFSAKMQLAVVLKEKGDLRKAQRISQDSFEGRSAIYGPYSPMTIHAKKICDGITHDIQRTQAATPM